jgi:hypothetical protein
LDKCTQEAISEIANQAHQIRQLRERPVPPSPIAVEILGIYVSGPASIHINVRIHNKGPMATTLHDWKLHSLSEPSIDTRIILPQGGEKLVKVGSGDVQPESISFQVHGQSLAAIRKREMAWCLKFLDTGKKPYEVVLPEALYPVS